MDIWNGHELGQTFWDGEGLRALACCSPWGHKELDTTGQLKNNKTKPGRNRKYRQTNHKCGN